MKNNISKTIKREIDVAFSKHTQPVWFRILKYILLGSMIYFFWESKFFWMILSILLVLALVLHFWYRHKTNGWTKSYGLWKYHSSESDIKNK